MHAVTKSFVAQWTAVNDEVETFFHAHAKSVHEEMSKGDDVEDPSPEQVASLVLTDVVMSLVVAAGHANVGREQLVELVGRAYDGFDIVEYAKTQVPKTPKSNLIGI